MPVQFENKGRNILPPPWEGFDGLGIVSDGLGKDLGCLEKVSDGLGGWGVRWLWEGVRWPWEGTGWPQEGVG